MRLSCPILNNSVVKSPCDANSFKVYANLSNDLFICLANVLFKSSNKYTNLLGLIVL